MASKRKWDEFDGSDDEEPSFGRQILPVANLPEDFNGIPCDGMQYLFTVRRDARNLPHITRAANPYETEIPQSSQGDIRDIPNYIALPSEAWRTILEIRFKNFRENLKQPTIHVQFTPQSEGRRLMPDKKERDLWWAYLAGKPEFDWNPPKKPKQQNSSKRWQFGYGMRGFADDREYEISYDRPRQESWQMNDEGEVELVLQVDPRESLPTPTGSPAPPDISNISTDPSSSEKKLEHTEATVHKPREPTPSQLRYIDEKMALHLLMYFSHWINLHLDKPTTSSRPNESHARWIFALLSRVEDHISADDMSLLRNLARACIALLKASITTRVCSEESAASDLDKSPGGFFGERSCWIIISTIAGVWAQRDLWTDVEDMLKTIGS
ncbi:hypothetical protein BDZ94DRAFT_1256268 [Collybia nuda]|uniref:Uncharacterized protein n=1 Tax=Collybia nuda TaxID=64659 RepID=A0A9P6CFU3_9AGAR|nr:hypothetical protein BDZ94DRAFT_1256268 [Collybia nuda]